VPAKNSFNHKSFNDPVHGPISLSQLECDIINTPIYMRLSRLKQLGLAYQVFPGATNTRFSHSLGAMHVMSRMIDAINARASKDGARSPIQERDKQKLRLAALLHDVGHYPLSHATEAVFFRNEEEQSGIVQSAEKASEGLYLHAMASAKKSEKVTHERFGANIVIHNSSLNKTLKQGDFDPEEIAGIFTGEMPKKPILSQLIHSTLDADRMDFLLRDSHFAGVTYGHVDLEFILSNLVYDRTTKLFAVDQKGITAFEHFIISRYYMYNNITYHKTVMALEFMAQTAYYEMAKEGLVIGDFKRLNLDINSKSMPYFDDDYFWGSLKEWKPRRKYFKRLRQDLLERRPLKMLYEERRLVDLMQNGREVDDEFRYLRNDKIHFDIRFKRMCRKLHINPKNLAIVTRKVKFEEQPPFTSHNSRTTDHDTGQLGKVYEQHEFKDLIDVKWAIIPRLSNYVQYIRRLYFFDIDKKNIDLTEFRSEFEAL